MTPGTIVLLGSGETSSFGQKIFDFILRQLPHSPRVSLLETPAGFELNSERVAGRIREFLSSHLQNHDPQVTVIPARKRDTAFSPDDPAIIAPLYASDLIFMGPGSPTYAVSQLRGSLAWDALTARHRLGGAIALSSAAVVAVGARVLPVYEIYKVGEDLHWKEGLDLFGPYGLQLVFIPHWNNQEGGEELDTRFCWMGRPRFDRLLALLPAGMTVVGIDETTGLAIDFALETCRVIGSGEITLVKTGLANASADWMADPSFKQYQHHQDFPIRELGEFHLPEPGAGIPPEVWSRALETARHPKGMPANPPESAVPNELQTLVEQREAARRDNNWQMADALREQIAAQGWQVIDTAEGPKLVQ